MEKNRKILAPAQTPHSQTHWESQQFLPIFFFFFGFRGIVHPPSDDEGTERTWFEPEQRPRKRVPKQSVHGKQSPQEASKMSWRQDDQP